MIYTFNGIKFIYSNSITPMNNNWKHNESLKTTNTQQSLSNHVSRKWRQLENSVEKFHNPPKIGVKCV